MKKTNHSDELIKLAHGGGGRLSQQLIEQVFLPVFGNEMLNRMDDSAVFDIPQSKLAFTTDSFVVDPVFFPGGDIGRLAICGTVNDLSVAGARPMYISIGFIIEEGCSIDDLRQIVLSAKEAADEAGVLIVTGDTKVVEKGHGDLVFINTSGIGVFDQDRNVSGSNAQTGDSIVVNGALGRHGMAVITSREGLGFQTRINSDVAPLNHLIEAMFSSTDQIHALRDATRGGLATVLNEIARQSGVSIEIDEVSIPVHDDVKGACEILGFDPLYVANEGVVVACVDGEKADEMVQTMRHKKYGSDSAVIGRITEKSGGEVLLKTEIGSHRILDQLSGEQLPRIC